NYGLFINAIITFLIVAFVLFLIIKGMNKAKAAMEEEAAAAPAEPSDEVKLLAEIRDALKK
ncbi:MAG: MscL family protein, partial [Arenicella sp.]